MAQLSGLFFTVTITLSSLCEEAFSHSRSFTVDYANNQFLKDGQPFRIISGSLHYFRVPRAYWKDRLLKMRFAGLNAVDVYVEWSGHEVEPGRFNFEGDYDLRAFLEVVKDVGLLVVFRPGPYICAERDNGGLPYWLLRLNPAMRYRSSDVSYIERVEKWFGVLLPLAQPYLYKNGGPIVFVQVENEYGHYISCDTFYMRHLVHLSQYYLGRDVLFFRTDEPNVTLYSCDEVQGPLVAADFGSDKDVDVMFRIVRSQMRHGPLFVAEYYSGWLDNWGRRHARVDQRMVLWQLERILRHNASVNFYMFHGGTNFGFKNGANPPAQPTSYDYGAPLTEAGDPTYTYFKIREVLGRYVALPKGAPPVPAPKLKLGAVNLNSCAPLEVIRGFLRKQGYVRPVVSRWPLPFEQLGQAYGYVVYTAKCSSLRPTSPAVLTVPGIKNRGYVLTAHTRAVISSDHRVVSTPVVVHPGENITILVENTGRINYGPLNHDMKGIISNVTLGYNVLSGWTMEPLPLDASHVIRHLTDVLGNSSRGLHCTAPAAFFGTFVLPKGQKALDTYLDPTGWGKGAAYVNGFNLGRYWPSIGPQVTLYVPGVLLHPYPKINTILLFETEYTPPGSRTVSFVDVPNIDGPVPGDAVRFTE
ncbi:beta-galactosidase-like [Rhipicephalus sanguineus]|uniref:beta-galactosidase-like n=1 Tax=Rhipicephalus sanguineus TaxID=34632 RepID=UPI0018959AAB|nr:beta-galactosidase-like [Rhipicephalus sanguineus]